MSSVVGSVPCLKVLLRHGIDINAKYGAGYTMMHSAVLNGREGLVDVLIEKGADMERKTYDKKLTPLHLGAKQGQVKLRINLFIYLFLRQHLILEISFSNPIP